MKQFTEFHEFQVYMVVENVKSLEGGWSLCICVFACVHVCMCVRVHVCVCVMSLPAPRVPFPVRSGSLVVSLYDRHEADTLGRNW